MQQAVALAIFDGDVGIFAVLQEVANGIGAIFLVYGGELLAVDGFESLSFIIYRCGSIALLHGYGGKAIVAVLVVSLENQTGQTSQLPWPIVQGNVFCIPCCPCSALESGHGLMAGITTDGVGTVGGLPIDVSIGSTHRYRSAAKKSR